MTLTEHGVAPLVMKKNYLTKVLVAIINTVDVVEGI
jgi:hypothetical protein